MKKIAGIFPLICVALALSGCATPRPAGFSEATAPVWKVIEIRDGVGYDRAWDAVFGILARDFDFSMVQKDVGYIQTDWLYTWAGVYDENYKVRVTVKFAPDRRSLQVRTEARQLENRTWIVGTDARLANLLRTDLMGTVGRTAR